MSQIINVGTTGAHGLTASDWIAMCSVVIATISAWVAFGQAFAARRHNRLSVYPHILIEKLLRYSEDMPYPVIVVHNRGIGPAIIHRTVWSSGGEFAIGQHHDEEIAFLAKHFPYPRDRVLFSHIANPISIAAGETRFIARFHRLTKKEASEIENKLRAVDLCVFYRSYYLDERICCPGNLLPEIKKRFKVPRNPLAEALLASRTSDPNKRWFKGIGRSNRP